MTNEDRAFKNFDLVTVRRGEREEVGIAYTVREGENFDARLATVGGTVSTLPTTEGNLRWNNITVEVLRRATDEDLREVASVQSGHTNMELLMARRGVCFANDVHIRERSAAGMAMLTSEDLAVLESVVDPDAGQITDIRQTYDRVRNAFVGA